MGCGRGGRNKDSTQALMAKTVIIIIIIFPQATGQKFGNVRVPGCVAPHEAMAGGIEQVLVCEREREKKRDRQKKAIPSSVALSLLG